MFKVLLEDGVREQEERLADALWVPAQQDRLDSLNQAPSDGLAGQLEYQANTFLSPFFNMMR